MRKILLLGFISWGILFCLIGCSSKDPLKAPELTGEDLGDFLNSSFGYGPVEHSETVKEVFYSGEQNTGFEISQPKYLGKKDNYSYYAIIISKEGVPVSNESTIVFFTYRHSGDEYYVDYVEQRKGKDTKKYEYIDERNPVLLSIYPTNYFKTVASEWDIQNQKLSDERAAEAQRAAEERILNLSIEDLPKNASQYKTEQLLEAISNPAFLVIPMNGLLGYDADNKKWVYIQNMLTVFTVTGQEDLLKHYENGSKANIPLNLEDERYIMFIQRKGKVVSQRGYNMNDINDVAKYALECAKQYTLQIDAIVSYSSMMGEIPENVKKRIFASTYGGAGTTDELFVLYSKGGYDVINKFAKDWVELSEEEARKNAGISNY
jgi:hypothetical protein